MSRGTETIEFKRGALIDGKQTNLTVSLSMNYKKGLIKTISKLDDGQVTGDPEIDESTHDLMKALTQKALEYGVAWRKKWKEENAPEHPEEGEGGADQIPMDL